MPVRWSWWNTTCLIICLGVMIWDSYGWRVQRVYKRGLERASSPARYWHITAEGVFVLYCRETGVELGTVEQEEDESWNYKVIHLNIEHPDTYATDTIAKELLEDRFNGCDLKTIDFFDLPFELAKPEAHGSKSKRH